MRYDSGNAFQPIECMENEELFVGDTDIDQWPGIIAVLI